MGAMQIIEHSHSLKMYHVQVSMALGADSGSQEPSAVHYQNPQYFGTLYSLDLKVNINVLYFIFGNIENNAFYILGSLA